MRTRGATLLRRWTTYARSTRAAAGRPRRRRDQPPPSARGLGWDHRQHVEALKRELVDGTPCWWCGHAMYRTQNLAGDHSVARARGGTRADRLLHLPCNAQRGDGSRDHERPALTGAPCPCPVGRAVAASGSRAPRTPPRTGSRTW